MPYTQFCAGTDTVYVSTLDDPDHSKARAAGYDYFETLSKVFDGLSGERAIPDGYERAQTKSTLLAAEKPQAKFVNGPETRGSDVGACIANNLLGVLEALARGETSINLVGHSRGAVAAMMVTHELEALRTGLQPGQSIYDALLKTPCPYTRAAVQAQRAKFEALSSEAIQQALQKASVNLFAIDPVPGGSILGLGGWVAWKDPRFYQLPSIVKKAQVIVYNHEHTRCFKPIVPMAGPGTELIVLNMSGHHGTGSGNLKAQDRNLKDRNLLDFDPEKTKCVQSLVLSQITRFLNENGMAFNEAHQAEVDITPQGQKQLYDEIVRNRAYFEKFNDTSYPFLRQEQGFWRMAPAVLQDWFGVEKQRIIHYHRDDDTYLSQVFPTLDGLENLEHVQQELRVTFDLVSQATDDPATILKNFLAKLTTFSSASNRNDPQCLRHIQHPMFDPIFQTLIQHIAQKYLRNHLSPEQKTELVKRIFEFCDFLGTRPELAAKLKQVKEAIVTTIEARQNALFERYEALLKPHASEDQDEPLQKCDELRALQHDLLEFKNGIEQFKGSLPRGIDIPFDPTQLDSKCEEINNAIAIIIRVNGKQKALFQRYEELVSRESPLDTNQKRSALCELKGALEALKNEIQAPRIPFILTVLELKSLEIDKVIRALPEAPRPSPSNSNEEPGITSSGESLTHSGSFSSQDSTITPAHPRTRSQQLTYTPNTASRRSSIASSVPDVPPRRPRPSPNKTSASFIIAVIAGLTAGAGLIALACMLLPPVGLVKMSVALGYAFSGVGFAAGTSLLGFFGYHATKECKASPQPPLLRA